MNIDLFFLFLRKRIQGTKYQYLNDRELRLYLSEILTFLDISDMELKSIIQSLQQINLEKYMLVEPNEIIYIEEEKKR